MPRNALILFLTGVAALTAAELRVTSGSVRPGEEVELAVELQGGNKQIASLDIELTYDTTNLDLSASPSRGSLRAHKILTTSISPRNAVRLLLVGSSRIPLPDGSVISLTVSPKEGITGSFPIRISAATATALSEKTIPLTSRNGTLVASKSAKSEEERELEQLKSEKVEAEKQK